MSAHTNEASLKNEAKDATAKAKDKTIPSKPIQVRKNDSLIKAMLLKDKLNTTPKMPRTNNIHKVPLKRNSSFLGNDQDLCLINSNEISNKYEDSTQEPQEYKLGQLAWAKIGKFPYWPCIVTPDPETKTFMKEENFKMKKIRKFHINYFADNGRRGWVSCSALMTFQGKEHFLNLLEKEEKQKKKTKKQGFFIKPVLKDKWNISVDEAMRYLPKTNLERLKIFHKELQELLTQPKKNKRKLDSEESDLKEKKRKIETSTPNSSCQDLNFIFATPESEGSTPKRFNRLENRIGLKVIEKNVSLDLGMTRESHPLYKKSRLENGVSVELLDTIKIEDDKEESSAKKLKRPESRMSERISERRKILEERKSLNNSWPEFTKNNGITKRPNGTINSVKIEKNGKISKDSTESSSEEDSVDEPVKEEKKSRPLNLFRGYKIERVCQICELPGDLIRCKGPCFSYFHLSCVKPDEHNSETESEVEQFKPNGVVEDVQLIKQKILEDQDKLVNSSDKESSVKEESFKCIDCLSGVAPACFICQEREGDRIKCSVMACGKYYHVDCLKLWPQAHWQGGRLTCPYHVCHSCISDNPQNTHAHHSINNDKLVKCVRCPSTYHGSISCVPAGSIILTGLQIVCPKHYKSPQPPINTTWCFLCTQGGSLICCDTCPMSFHAECLSIKPPEGAYICEDCETGRLPLYGEIIWAKLGNYRWWPSVVCYPNDIPENVARLNHNPGEFCVKFFGSNDYYWVHRGRVFLYQEGDAKGTVNYSKSATTQTYVKALEVAHEMHTKFKMNREVKKTEEHNRRLKPPRYVKLKCNKPYGNVKAPELDSIVACNCNPNAEKPCAPEANCINRMLCIECSIDVCPAGSRCQNQDFQQRNYPSMKPFHTEDRGWGLKALEKIKQGRFVVEYVGEIIDEAEYKRRLQRKKETKNENFYFLTIDNNRMIDAEPKGNLSRFMNHSCQPNCETQKWTVNGDTRIGLFALRDIEPSEELTFNYQLQCDGEQRKPCLCGAPNCSGFIGLKANKIQLNTIDEKIKREKYRGRKITCFKCGLMLVYNNDIVRCTENQCIKRYHKSCLGLSNIPSNFICPYHKCGDCNRKSLKNCNSCCVAWCKVHYSADKMRQHKIVHEDRYEIDESQISQIENSTLDENYCSIEELTASNCSTRVGKAKDPSAKKLKKDKHKNLKTPLSVENSVEKAKNKSVDEKNISLALKDSESKVSSVKHIDTNSTLKSKNPTKEISDTENQSPPKIIAEFPQIRRKIKNLITVEEVPTNKKTDVKKFVMKNLKDQREETNNLQIDDDMMLRMFFDTSTFDKEMACKICKKAGNVIRCNGFCSKYFHEHCANSKVLRRNGYRTAINDHPKIFKCNDCISGVTPNCQVCNKSSQFITNCFVTNCNNYYHSACLQMWPQSITIKGKSVCPQHVCHTCASKDLMNNKQLNIDFTKMHKCVRCFAAYHSYPWCIPAGSIILSSNAIICPKHFVRKKIENFDWCFKCSNGEANVHCTECPISYHEKCVGNIEKTYSFLCKNCKYGKLPRYNEVVWVKVNSSYGCWPAVICTNSNIPFSLLQTKYQPGEFCVHFLEANKYGYVGREQITPFNGDTDVEIVKLRDKNVDDVFAKALTNAQTLSKQFEMLMQKKISNIVKKLPEPEYEFISKNVTKYFEYSLKLPIVCKCNPLLENCCGSGSNCLNRISKVECDPMTCPAGKNCKNQSFSTQQYFSVEKFCTDNRGLGLRILEPVLNGDFIIEFIGEIIDKKSIRRRALKKKLSERNICYIQLNKRRFIDTENKGNFCRFINHSCEPNCEVQLWVANKQERIGIFAIRDIKIGEELTILYKVIDDTRIPCLCGSPNCSGFVGLIKESTKVNSNSINDLNVSINAGSSINEIEQTTMNTSGKQQNKCVD